MSAPTVASRQGLQQALEQNSLPPVSPSRDQHNQIRVRATYLYLVSKSKQQPLDHTLAKMLSSWRTGIGAMPAWFGLGRERFEMLFRRHFGDARWHYNGAERSEPDFNRAPEMDDLRGLLLDHSTTGESSIDMAELLVIGCLGQDHLWQDMGFWSRRDLSEMIRYNFPHLADKNKKDMKWKKFFYKQMCEGEGIYVCRAPSCEVCVDYSNCFATE